MIATDAKQEGDTISEQNVYLGITYGKKGMSAQMFIEVSIFLQV